MQAEDRAGHRVLQRALGDHHLGAALLAFRRHLLGRLEDELHGPAQLRAHAGQDRGHAQQDGHVAVVAAGVHHAHLLAVPRRAHLRREGQVHLLGHRQRVHVGAQRDRRAGQGTLQHPDDAGVRHAGTHGVEAQRLQVRLHDACGAELAVAQLGVLVQVAPPGDDLGFDGLGRAVDAGGEGTGDDLGLRHGLLHHGMATILVVAFHVAMPVTVQCLRHETWHHSHWPGQREGRPTNELCMTGGH